MYTCICSSDLQSHLEGIEEHISRQKQALREASAKHQVSSHSKERCVIVFVNVCLWITECLLLVTHPGWILFTHTTYMYMYQRGLDPY